MPLEFALRPRIRLSEGFAQPRRPRWRIPKLALPIAAYWLTAAGITYELIHLHDQPDAAVATQPEAALPATAAREWWRLAPAPAAATPPEREPVPSPPATPTAEPALAVDDSPVARERATDSDTALAANDVDDAAAVPARPRDREPNEALGAPAEHRRKRASSDPPTDELRADTVPDSRSLSGDAIRAPDLFPLPPLAPTGDAPPLLGGTPPDAPAAVASALPSCEAAAADQEIDVAHRDNRPDLSRDAIAGVLDNGVWIARCDIPMSTSIELCVAIKGGSVIGASVTSRPRNAAINACVKRRAAGLHFPFSSRVDIAKTHF